MIEWSKEWPRIRDVAIAHGVDPYFIAAIRVAENGGPGREFGVVSIVAPDYINQLTGCCNTIRHRLSEVGMHYRVWITPTGLKRLIYDDVTLQYIARKYAPVGAANDPSALNVNWYNNVRDIYHRFSDEGVPVGEV